MAYNTKATGVAFSDPQFTDINVTSTAALPSGTTVGGSSVLALGTVTSTSTTANNVSVTNTGVYTGTGVMTVVADSATTGVVVNISGAGLTSGNALKVAAGAGTTAGNYGALFTSSSVAGSTLGVQNTGVGTGTADGLAFDSDANSATTGLCNYFKATSLTTGTIMKLQATQATLTTGRYLSLNDSATEVFGIGLNGHLISTVSAAPPSCAITTAQGITAATITAGSTDTCGVITTTGTQNNTADSTFTITFGKTYTTAPKSVTLTAANGAGANGTSLPYVSSISATAVVIGVTKSATASATPSWYYQIIA